MIGRGDAPLSFIEVSDLVNLMILVATNGDRANSLTTQGTRTTGLVFITQPQVIFFP